MNKKLKVKSNKSQEMLVKNYYSIKAIVIIEILLLMLQSIKINNCEPKNWLINRIDKLDFKYC